MIMMVIWWLYMSLASWSLHDHGNHTIFGVNVTTCTSWSCHDHVMITFMITKFMITLWSYCCQSSTYLENHGVDMWWAKLTCGGLIQAPSRHDGLHKWWARYKLSWSHRDHVVIMIDHVLFATPLIMLWAWSLRDHLHDYSWSCVIMHDHVWSRMIAVITNDHSFLSNPDHHTTWPITCQLHDFPNM